MDKELERSNKEQMHRLKLYRADRNEYQQDFDWTPSRFRWCKTCKRSPYADFTFHWNYHLMEEIN